MITAFIFDLDGVLVDTAKYHYIAWKKLADELGVPFTETDNERLKGVSRMDSLDIILSIGALSLPNQRKIELAKKKNNSFVEFINNMSPDEIFPGVKDLLVSIKEKQFGVALASSSKNAPAVLRLLKIEDLFDVVVDGTMVNQAKPDPKIFLLAAELLGKHPSQCVVFEDAEAGVEAAKRANMKCIGIGNPQSLSKADLIIPQVADFKLTDLENI